MTLRCKDEIAMMDPVVRVKQKKQILESFSKKEAVHSIIEFAIRDAVGRKTTVGHTKSLELFGEFSADLLVESVACGLKNQKVREKKERMDSQTLSVKGRTWNRK